MRERKKAERDSLVLSEQTFPIIEQITAGMPGGFFIYHADGDKRLIYANRALIRIYGCADLSDFQAYTGYTFPGLVYPEDLEMTERSIQQQLLTGEIAVGIGTCGMQPQRNGERHLLSSGKSSLAMRLPVGVAAMPP